LCLFSFSMFLLFFCLFFSLHKKKKKKIGGEDAQFLFFILITFQILHVFLPDISVHCALIKLGLAIRVGFVSTRLTRLNNRVQHEPDPIVNRVELWNLNTTHLPSVLPEHDPGNTIH
jgi:uncharacterized membrane protein YozB (DUF420 family)